MWQDERALVVLSQRECLALLRTEQVGRVVFTERALPAVVPITFAVLDDAIVLATRAGTRLARSARGGVLAFEADRLDPVTRTGWSVVVTGMAEYVVDPRDGVGKDVRAEDGFHLNEVGAEILALDIAEVVKDDLRARGAAI